MSLNEFGFSVVLSGLFTMPLSLAPAWTVSSMCQPLRRKYRPPATAAPVAVAPNMNLRRLKYEDLEVISEDGMSPGFLISKLAPRRTLSLLLLLLRMLDSGWTRKVTNMRTWTVNCGTSRKC